MTDVSTGSRRSHKLVRTLCAPLALAGGLMVTMPFVGSASASASPLLAYGPKPITIKVIYLKHKIIIVISGGGLPHKVRIIIKIKSDPQTLGTLNTGSTGSFSFAGDLPTNLLPGNHTVTITGPGINISQVVYFSAAELGRSSSAATTAASSTATGSTASSSGTAGTTTASSSPSTSLAFTGTDITLTASAGALLIGGGGILVLSSRKRRQRAWSL